MVEEPDIWRSANVMVRRYGEDAAIEAARRADACLADGDVEGSAIWKRIVAAIEDLQRNQPRAGEGRH